MINLTNHEPDIDEISLYAKDPYDGKYQLLINKRKSADLKYLNDPKVFIEYSNNMDHIYRNIEKYNPNIKRKVLIVFDDMIADMLNNKNLIKLREDQRKTVKYFSCFYHTILFRCSERY